MENFVDPTNSNWVFHTLSHTYNIRQLPHSLHTITDWGYIISTRHCTKNYVLAYHVASMIFRIFLYIFDVQSCGVWWGNTAFQVSVRSLFVFMCVGMFLL
jgi:hypothetical protein